MANLESFDMGSIDGRYDWLREQAVSQREIALGDGRSLAEEMLAEIAKQGMEVGDDLRFGVQLFADRTAAPDFESWLRLNFDKPRGALPWAVSVERVETIAGPAVSVWHDESYGLWKAVPLAAIGQNSCPVLNLSREGGAVRVEPIFSFPSVWGWLWNTFFSKTGSAGINQLDLVFEEEMAAILTEANATFGHAAFADEDTVFFATRGIYLWLGRMGGEWRSALTIDHVDQITRLSGGFLEALQVPTSRIELARDGVEP